MSKYRRRADGVLSLSSFENGENCFVNERFKNFFSSSSSSLRLPIHKAIPSLRLLSFMEMEPFLRLTKLVQS
jgi:hypothetical protein